MCCGVQFVKVDEEVADDVVPKGTGDFRTVGVADNLLLDEGDVPQIVLLEQKDCCLLGESRQDEVDTGMVDGKQGLIDPLLPRVLVLCIGV